MLHSDSASSVFKENFNYFAAFLALLIGLGTFRDFAEANGLNLFNTYFSFLQISLPFVILMTIAIYVGSLAFMSRTFNFSH